MKKLFEKIKKLIAGWKGLKGKEWNNEKQDQPADDVVPDNSATAGNALPAIRWLGSDYSRAVETAKIAAAHTDGRNLFTSYQPYRWHRITVKVEVNAIACFFYERGEQIVGGKFDWWRVGGQGTKGLENVHAGYAGHVMPRRGTKCWTMIVSVDGKQRSNLCEVKWK